LASPLYAAIHRYVPAADGVKGSEVAVAVGGPPESGRLADAKACAPVQVASLGPKSVNVTVPVGAGALAGPVTLAVSLIGLPTVWFGVACVVTVGVAAATVVTSEPEPVPIVPSWCVPRPKPTWFVCAPGVAGKLSWLGTLFTLTAKATVHWSRSLETLGGPSTTGPPTG
jgi:hypothetical protein